MGLHCTLTPTILRQVSSCHIGAKARVVDADVGEVGLMENGCIIV